VADTALAMRAEAALAAVEDEFPIQRLVAQKASIQRAMTAVMKPDEHYGIIPGTGKNKPSLFQPGADTLCFLFRLRADYEPVHVVEQETWLAFTIRCRLFHIDTGKEWGSGMGSANSREKRYASQASAKSCPKCGKTTIIKGKDEYGGGWLCWKKQGGCDAKFKDGDATIENQAAVATTGVWDLHNTIWKMACKRARVAAVLTATAASDCFTQDLEDLVDAMPSTVYTPPKAQPQNQQQRQPAKSAPAPTTGGSASPPSDARLGVDAPMSAALDKDSEPAPDEPGRPRITEAHLTEVQMSVTKLGLGKEEVARLGLRGENREKYIRGARLAWLAWATGRQVSSTLDLYDDEVPNVLARAKAGEMPS
jgi:hypothetical protein